jgi:hypothetical protein
LSLIWATWITALATAGLLVGAVLTARYAKKAFFKQSQEVALIQQQVKDQLAFNAEQVKLQRLQADDLRASLAQREREVQERRRAQAIGVFTWIERLPGPTGALYRIHIKNASNQPTYDITATLNGQNDSGPVKCLTAPGKIPNLMPGEQAQLPTGPPLEWKLISDPESVWVAAQFRDTAGINWRITEYGELIEL